jgi:crossover junction endodeoxyribonuclease RuvC
MGRVQPKRAPRLVASAQVILGFDPGLARLGFGAVRVVGNRMQALEYGTLTTPAGMPVPERLALLFNSAREIIARVKPCSVAVEELFFSKNVKTAMVVAQARGVVLLACGLEGVPVYEVKPGAVKLAVTGYGRAEKGQVQRMVRLLLGLAEDPKPDDTADALAVAIAHAQYPVSALEAIRVSKMPDGPKPPVEVHACRVPRQRNRAR